MPANYNLAELPIVEGMVREFDTFPHSMVFLSGPRKSGKSSAAATWPRPLFLDFEERSLFIDAPRALFLANLWVEATGKYMDLNEVPRGQRVKAIIETLKIFGAALKADAGAKYETIIFDTVDRLWDVLYHAYIYDNNLENRSTQSFTVYNDLYKQIKPVLERYRQLAGCGYHVILVAHSQKYYNEEHKTDAYKLMLPEALDKWMTGLGLVNIALVPDQNGVARMRMTQHPCYPSGDGTGRFPDWIPATFQALEAAYRHDDDYACEENQPRYKIWSAPVRADKAKGGNGR
jgi:hypothetical protein